jgi:hypothetical protein
MVQKRRKSNKIEWSGFWRPETIKNRPVGWIPPGDLYRSGFSGTNNPSETLLFGN